MKNQNGNKFLDEKGYYREKDKSEIGELVDYVVGLWDDFLASQNLSDLEFGKDYFIHTRNLFEVVKRFDKRKTYYYVFHQIEEICEYKQIGLLCYWINTLKPFMVVNEKCPVYNCPNEMFSLYLIISTLAKIFNNTYPDRIFEKLDAETIQDYVYNFKYCDLSREATIFFVETLAKSYGIGMETNTVNDRR